jgi:hypothetical protein
MTLQDAAAVYNELIRELSLNLMLHQAHAEHPAPPHSKLVLLGGRPPLDNMRIAFDK